jgi:hypothetical protein
MTNAYSILEAAATSRKGGVRITAEPLTLATTFNALRRMRQKYPGTFGHLVFKRKQHYVDILNGRNIVESLEEIFSAASPPEDEGVIS